MIKDKIETISKNIIKPSFINGFTFYNFKVSQVQYDTLNFSISVKTILNISNVSQFNILEFIKWVNFVNLKNKDILLINWDDDKEYDFDDVNFITFIFSIKNYDFNFDLENNFINEETYEVIREKLFNLYFK